MQSVLASIRRRACVLLVAASVLALGAAGPLAAATASASSGPAAQAAKKKGKKKGKKKKSACKPNHPDGDHDGLDKGKHDDGDGCTV
ncbi:MAG TPA: hypothetical protein VHE14_07580 [Solirubrobacteraceae bacterium]|nr:hypothetical protein [Solirubrobacteraceae bacterium]